MEHSTEIAALAAAFAKAQGAFQEAQKGGKVESFNNTKARRYTTLSDILDAVRSPLSENGLSILQFPSFTQNMVIVETLLTHESGQWIRHILQMVMAPNPGEKMQAIQVAGSAISYAKRYAIESILCVSRAEDDDDGAGTASGNSTSKGRSQGNTTSTAVAINATNAACPSCNCPPGKPHGTGCKGVVATPQEAQTQSEDPAPAPVVAEAQASETANVDSKELSKQARQRFEAEARDTYALMVDSATYGKLALALLGAPPVKWNAEAWDKARQMPHDAWLVAIRNLGLESAMAEATGAGTWPGDSE